eukprot:2165426-Karenia_brevis.AAC.1
MRIRWMGALYVLKTATAVGIDLWSPGDLRKLPKAALRALAQILVQIEKTGHMAILFALECHRVNGNAIRWH